MWLAVVSQPFNARCEAPLLRDMPWARELTLNGAIRLADYSHAGDATAYMVRGTWSPMRDVTFRGTYSKAVRVPNVGELLDAQPAVLRHEHRLGPAQSGGDLGDRRDLVRARGPAGLGKPPSGGRRGVVG